MRKFVFIAAVIAFLAIGGFCINIPKIFADAQSFNSSADSYLRSGYPNQNNGSIIVMDLNDNRDGVVRFDISAIPAGSAITSATLTLAATAVNSATAVKNYGAHRILADWAESTVTWNTPGSTAGTHFASSPTETIAVTNVGLYNWNVVSDVTSFVNGSATNYGWRIIWSHNTSGTYKQVDFGTKENSTASNRPVLNVIYTPPHTLTYTAGANGSVTGTSPQTINHGADGTEVTAVANSNYHFTSWSDGVLTAARTDTNVTADISATASFAIDTHTLTYTAGSNGSITGTNPQTVDHGLSGTEVTAIPDSNYHFTSWSDGITTAIRTDANVLADISATANFAIDTHTLTYTASANGSITGISPQTVNHGADGTEVTAAANSNYHFTSWSDGVLTASRTDTNVTADISATANFEVNAASRGGGGGGGGGGGAGLLIINWNNGANQTSIPTPAVVPPPPIVQPEIALAPEPEILPEPVINIAPEAIETPEGETRPPENLNAEPVEVGPLEAPPETTAPPKQTFFAAALSNIVMPIILAVVNFFKNLRWR